MSRVGRHLILAGCLSAACDNGVLRAFEPSASMLGDAGERGTDPQPGGGSAGGPGGGGSTSIEPVAGAGAGGAPSPLLIDDFEDGDTRAKEPRGWWYPINDETGTQGFGIEPISSGTTSVYALRTHGSGFQDWGAAVGVNLLSESTPLNALSYEELCFTARVEAGTDPAIRVHFVRDGDRHYEQALSLSEDWARYCVPLGGFIGPDDAALVAKDLLALQFFFAPRSPFALWLDDVEFSR
jgi:hypothetical protein